MNASFGSTSGARRGPTPRTPIWLCLIIIGTMALLYLSQVNRASAANARLQDARDVSDQLTARRQSDKAELGRVSSPTYIIAQARQMGLTPGNWGDDGKAAQP